MTPTITKLLQRAVSQDVVGKFVLYTERSAPVEWATASAKAAYDARDPVVQALVEMVNLAIEQRDKFIKLRFDGCIPSRSDLIEPKKREFNSELDAIAAEALKKMGVEK